MTEVEYKIVARHTTEDGVVAMVDLMCRCRVAFTAPYPDYHPACDAHEQSIDHIMGSVNVLIGTLGAPA